jgi:hypothetical protein
MYDCIDLTSILFPSRQEHYQFLGNVLYQNYKTLCLLTSGKVMILKKYAIQGLDSLAQSHSMFGLHASCVEVQVGKR